MVKCSLLRTAALAAVLGTVAFASPSFAAPVDPTAPSGPPNSTINYDANGHTTGTPDTSADSGSMMMQDNGGNPPATTAPAGQSMHHHMKDHAEMKKHGPEDMKEHVEERIKSLHEKLMITKDQETDWSQVAQAMRDSEASVSTLIQQRHEKGGTMNAVDDLESYQAIAQAHADGLKKVNDAFKTLYDSMSDEQKKNADKVFGGYEGHGPEEHHMKHHHPKAAQ